MKDKNRGWIGVDLDGTSAHYDVWRGAEHIGDPVSAMAARIRGWLQEGREVRIFTARVDGGEAAAQMGETSADAYRDVQRITEIIQDWTELHFGVRLQVTNRKDFGMVSLWDDRAVQIEANTGRRMDGQSDHDDYGMWLIS